MTLWLFTSLFAVPPCCGSVYSNLRPVYSTQLFVRSRLPDSVFLLSPSLSVWSYYPGILCLFLPVVSSSFWLRFWFMGVISYQQPTDYLHALFTLTCISFESQRAPLDRWCGLTKDWGLTLNLSTLNQSVHFSYLSVVSSSSIRSSFFRISFPSLSYNYHVCFASV